MMLAASFSLCYALGDLSTAASDTLDVVTSTTPTALSKSAEFRRGWRVLLGCALGIAVGGPSLFYLPAGVFMKAIEADLHFSRTALSGGLFAFTLAMAIASPFVGGLIDRYGVRKPILVSMCALVLVYLGFAYFLESLLGFYVLCVLCALAGVGSTALSFSRAVADWFSTARGIAVGLMLMGTGVTVALVPLTLTKVISAYGWRGGYIASALIVAVVIVPVALLVKLRGDEGHALRPLARGCGKQGRVALYSGTFWMLIVAFMLLSTALSGFTVHLVPLLTDEGLTPVQAASFAGLMGVAAIAGRLVVGFLVDHVFAPYVAAPILLLSAAGCATLGVIGISGAPFAAMAIGLGAGAELELMGYLTARYFRPTEYGRAYGWQFGGFAIANGFSPLWIAGMHEAYGTYDAALVISAVILLGPTAMFLRLPKY